MRIGLQIGFLILGRHECTVSVADDDRNSIVGGVRTGQVKEFIAVEVAGDEIDRGCIFVVHLVNHFDFEIRIKDAIVVEVNGHPARGRYGDIVIPITIEIRHGHGFRLSDEIYRLRYIEPEVVLETNDDEIYVLLATPETWIGVAHRHVPIVAQIGHEGHVKNVFDTILSFQDLELSIDLR